MFYYIVTVMDKKQLTCKRCGYTWTPHKGKKPGYCPHCNSPYWNKERRTSSQKAEANRVAALRVEIAALTNEIGDVRLSETIRQQVNNLLDLNWDLNAKRRILFIIRAQMREEKERRTPKDADTYAVQPNLTDLKVQS